MAKSKKRQHRQDLFDRQAEKLASFVHGDGRRLMICPLCLRAWEEQYLNLGQDLSIEHAPPQQYGQGVERCLTCAVCNNDAGSTFETRVGVLNGRRHAAVLAARPRAERLPSGLVVPPFRPAVPVPAKDAFDLATVSSDERKLELKSAYLIAFATLGYSYVLSEGAGIVRAMLLDTSNLAGVFVCAVAQGLPTDKVLVAIDPLECILVPHPTRHDRTGAPHVVVLPLPGSPADFYDRVRALRALPGKHRWTTYGDYAMPSARRLPMHWDADHTHPYRSAATWTLECGCDPATVQHDPIQIRLGQPRIARTTDVPSTS